MTTAGPKEDADLDSGKRALKLSGELTIHTAAEVHATLVNAVKARPTDYELDLSEATEIDTAGVQILMAFKRAAAPVRVNSCPEAIREFLRRICLEHLLL
jgi:ABC-type transporter Mla MlaB component